MEQAGRVLGVVRAGTDAAPEHRSVVGSPHAGSRGESFLSGIVCPISVPVIVTNDCMKEDFAITPPLHRLMEVDPADGSFPDHTVDEDAPFLQASIIITVLENTM
ncbi:hypothetical protein chiPu_0013066 [Chiloscyllium punctatum]|uniref:Uncharacterized protein n=1 Tax=Chiloscyllium punctatum TaxID=137246 RepID=A0A401SW33_CHIPU|nr:hypothetical protein [Chiloscyllium punctatum]